MAFKKQVDEPVLNGQMSKRFTAKKHGVSRNTVASWCREINTVMIPKHPSRSKKIKQLRTRSEFVNTLKH